MPGHDKDHAMPNVAQVVPDQDDDGYRLANDINRTGSPDERTGLLGAGAHSHDTDDAALLSRKDSWAGAEEFAGLPWHKRPSVFWLVPPYALFTLAFGGSIVPKLNLYVAPPPRPTRHLCC